MMKMRTMMMKMKERSFKIGVTGSKNYQSVRLEESFTVEVNENFSELDFAKFKQEMKDRLMEETKKEINNFVEERELDDNLDLEI